MPCQVEWVEIHSQIGHNCWATSRRSGFRSDTRASCKRPIDDERERALKPFRERKHFSLILQARFFRKSFGIILLIAEYFSAIWNFPAL